MATPRSPFLTRSPGSSAPTTPFTPTEAGSYWHAASAKGSTIDRFFDQPELPLYKDKPHGYRPARRAQPFWRRQPLVLPLVLLVLGGYWLLAGARWGPRPQLPAAMGSGSGHGIPIGTAARLRDMVKKAHGESHGRNGQPDWAARRECVREAFRLSWDAYTRDAWGMDVYHPLTQTGQQTAGPGTGWIIVDSLDSLILMNLTSRLEHAREWIATSLDYAQDAEVNTFEATVRLLGGLLSAHHLTLAYPNLVPLENVNHDLFIEKAIDLGDRLIGAFDSASGVPYPKVHLESRRAIPAEEDEGATPLAEAAATALEWKYLATLLKDHLYWEIAEKVTQIIDDQGSSDGLVPETIDPATGILMGNHIQLGSRGDAYYESLLKQYLLTAKSEPVYRTLWEEALAGVRKHLVTYSASTRLTFISERPFGIDSALRPRMEHRACFLPGAIALGITGGLTVDQMRWKQLWGPKAEDELRLARELTKTCYGMAKAMDTGLAPEAIQFETAHPPRQERDGPLTSKHIDWHAAESRASWRGDYHVPTEADAAHRQRPDIVEALFYMHRITGDGLYREWAWDLFQHWIEHSLLDSGGFASLRAANQLPASHADGMEAWWMAGTLKYLYLIFSAPDVLPLDQVVFNTEGHPFPVFNLTRNFRTGWTRKDRDADGKIVEHPSPPVDEEHESEEGTGGEETHEPEKEGEESEGEESSEEGKVDDGNNEEHVEAGNQEGNSEEPSEENDEGTHEEGADLEEPSEGENREPEAHEEGAHPGEPSEGEHIEPGAHEGEGEGEIGEGDKLLPPVPGDQQPDVDGEENWSWSIHDIL